MSHLLNDICRCTGVTCGIRYKCRRFSDIGWPEGDPYAHVSYADFSLHNVPGVECRYLILEEDNAPPCDTP